MNCIELNERECIIIQALTAKSLQEIESAAQNLRDWILMHPEDLNAEDALEPLALRRGALLSSSMQSEQLIASR